MNQREDNEESVITVLEGRVATEQWSVLQAAYAQLASSLPADILESFLLQAADDPTVWRILTVWRSREALEAMRRSTAVPGGVAVFHSAGSEPSLAIYQVQAHTSS